jgi:hypothetical protein
MLVNNNANYVYSILVILKMGGGVLLKINFFIFIDFDLCYFF